MADFVHEKFFPRSRARCLKSWRLCVSWVRRRMAAPLLVSLLGSTATPASPTISASAVVPEVITGVPTFIASRPQDSPFAPLLPSCPGEVLWKTLWLMTVGYSGQGAGMSRYWPRRRGRRSPEEPRHKQQGREKTNLPPLLPHKAIAIPTRARTGSSRDLPERCLWRSPLPQQHPSPNRTSEPLLELDRPRAGTFPAASGMRTSRIL